MHHSIIFSIILTAIAVHLDMASAAAAPDQDGLAYVTGSTKKVSQLTGDFDGTIGKPTLSQTGKRFGVIATDLGSSFEHKGNLFFLFGDTVGRPGDRDGVAWTESRDPKQILLNFYLDTDGKWLPLTVPGVDLGAFEVPGQSHMEGNLPPRFAGVLPKGRIRNGGVMLSVLIFPLGRTL